MKTADCKAPGRTGPATIFLAIMIFLSVGLLIISFISMMPKRTPDNMVEIHCSFRSYETKRHTRSTSYDLLLTSADYDLPFEFSFFDGYKKQITPAELCQGTVYIVRAALYGSSYEIYELSDGEDMLLTKQEAYQKSQGGAAIASSIFFTVAIGWWVFLLLMLHRPTLLSDRVKQLLFKPKKTISDRLNERT